MGTSLWLVETREARVRDRWSRRTCKSRDRQIARLPVCNRSHCEQPSAIIQPDERHDIWFFAFPFRLNRPAHDGKRLDFTRAGTFFPGGGALAARASLRRRPAKTSFGRAEWQQQTAFACGLPVRRGLSAVSRCGIFHAASRSSTPCVANNPPIPWVMVILAFEICRFPASPRSCTTASIKFPIPAARPG